MTITCKNCESHFKGHFCSNCGQAAHTHDINFHYLWHEIQHGILHVDSGLLFTTKQLFTRPGHAIPSHGIIPMMVPDGISVSATI